VTTQSDDTHLIAAQRVGRRLAVLATKYNTNVNISQAFHRFVAGVTQSIWDLNYESFQLIMRTVISDHQNHLDQAVLVFAGFLHICEALQQVGGDTSRQNQFANYVGRFMIDQGLMSWVEQQGGWVSHPYDLLLVDLNVYTVATNWKYLFCLSTSRYSCMISTNEELNCTCV